MIRAYTTRPVFWIVLAGIFIFGNGFAYKYFSTALPILNVSITMDREEARKQASQLAEKYGWGPKNFTQATLFGSDTETKNFIELEGGGKEKLNEIIEENHHALYTWNVRHFAEGEVNETLIKFTADSRPFGFVETIAETEPGPALHQNQARTIAEEKGRNDWNIDFNNYTLVESSKKEQPNHRVDHTFTYEEKNRSIGSAPYRLNLVVKGSKLTEKTSFIKIPDDFKRRYQHMRSSNNTLATAATIIMALLYILGGCFFGLIWLMRRRYVLWKWPLFWAAFIATAKTLSSINEMPLFWMSYPTALDKKTFLLSFVWQLFISFGGTLAGFALIFAAAESLTRYAFGNQPQLWRMWSKEGRSSLETFGRTVGGYLILGFDFAFVVFIYGLSLKYFGWWTPSESLINPNVLSTYIPWISPLSSALSAGFMEECLFRAIPLALAAIIGKKLGRKRLFMILGFIIQAVIFSAAHANYPAQPAYARLVELLIPSTTFGLIYLWFGLLPGIIAHFVYDAVLMALPIFVSTAPGIIVDKIITVALFSTPLWITLFSVLKNKKWSDLPKSLYNNSWKPAAVSTTKKITKPTLSLTEHPKTRFIFAALAGLSFCILPFITKFGHDGTPLTITQPEAKAKAAAVLENKAISLAAQWQSFATVTTPLNNQHRFVWQTQGKETYKNLLGTYLETPQQKIRYAQFDTDIVSGAEEYNIFIDNNGNEQRFQHRIPESEKRVSLSEHDARKKVHEFLHERYNIDHHNFNEISAVSSKKPNRIDWTFTFKDPAYCKPEKSVEHGEARICVELSGPEITDSYRYIFVPEKWQRADIQKQTLNSMINSICTVFLFFFFALGFIAALQLLLSGTFNFSFFGIFFAIISSGALIRFATCQEALFALFSTSEPFMLQYGRTLGITVVAIIFKALFGAFCATFVCQASFYIRQSKSYTTILLNGIGAGILITLMDKVCEKIAPLPNPVWADYTMGNASIPWLNFGITKLLGYFLTTILMYSIFYVFDEFTKGWQKNQALCIGLAFVTGIALQGILSIDTITPKIVAGLVCGIDLLVLYIFIIRFNRAIIPVAMGVSTILLIIQESSFVAWPGMMIGTAFAIILIALISLLWSKLAARHD